MTKVKDIAATLMFALFVAQNIMAIGFGLYVHSVESFQAGFDEISQTRLREQSRLLIVVGILYVVCAVALYFRRHHVSDGLINSQHWNMQTFSKEVALFIAWVLPTCFVSWLPLYIYAQLPEMDKIGLTILVLYFVVICVQIPVHVVNIFERKERQE